MSNGLNTQGSGSIPTPKTQSTKTIHASGQAREGFTRVVFGGILLAILAIAYVVALFCKIDEADKILLIVGSGIGFLLGRGSRGNHSDE